MLHHGAGSRCSAPAPLLYGVENEARQQLIDQLNDRAFRMLEQCAKSIDAIPTRDAAERRKAAVRQTILRAMNGLPEQRGPLHVKTAGTLDREGFRIEQVTFESLPGFAVMANVYVPATGPAPFAAVLMTPGHGPNGKAGEYQLAANFARNGILVLAYDVMGQGERLQYFDAATGKSKVGGPTGEHSQAALQSEIRAYRRLWLLGRGHGYGLRLRARRSQRQRRRRATSQHFGICCLRRRECRRQSRAFRISSRTDSISPTGSKLRPLNPMPLFRPPKICSRSRARSTQSKKRSAGMHCMI